MKPALATLISLVVFIIGWMVIALIMSAIGAVASQARSGVGLLHYVHVLLLWILSPGIGGFFAVYVTSIMFKSVLTHTIYVSFVSVIAVILIILFFANVASPEMGGSSFGGIIIFGLQAAAVFLGARVGKAVVDDVRPETSTQ